jgi:hypothetical protein
LKSWLQAVNFARQREYSGHIVEYLTKIFYFNFGDYATPQEAVTEFESLIDPFLKRDVHFVWGLWLFSKVQEHW